MTSNEHRFPLLELPDDVLANVLQRCPPGSIAGFPLPLALAQVRLTGSVDPHWVRPLLHVASMCPAVLDRVSRHLRSIELPCGYAETLPVIIPPPILSRLSRLERLEHRGGIPLSQLSTLPTSLTRLTVDRVDLEGGSLEDLCASLLRLTALEDLDLGEFPKMAGWTVGGSLPRLRRLECSGRPPGDLGTFAPNLEALDAQLQPQDLEGLPATLVELWTLKKFCHFQGSLLPLTRLSGLKDLALNAGMGIPEELPELLGALAALTRLEVRGSVDSSNLPQLVDALERGPHGLGVCLRDVYVDDDSPAVEQLFKQLVEVQRLKTDCIYLLPWAAFTRLTRLVLEEHRNEDTSWIEPLSELPSLRDLEVRLRGRVPEGFGALTQCTRLELSYVRSAGNLSCLQHLTRLRECKFGFSCPLPVESLLALPDCLTKLNVWDMTVLPDQQLRNALDHLTALEDLEITWREGEDRVCDLSLLKRLTSLTLIGVPCPLVRLDSLPCLRRLYLNNWSRLDGSVLPQLEKTPSLRELQLWCGFRSEPLTDATLASLPRLSLLEVLELDHYQTPPRGYPVFTSEGLRRLLDRLPLLVVKGRNPPLRTDPAWAELKQQAGNRLQM